MWHWHNDRESSDTFKIFIQLFLSEKNDGLNLSGEYHSGLNPSYSFHSSKSLWLIEQWFKPPHLILVYEVLTDDSTSWP